MNNYLLEVSYFTIPANYNRFSFFYFEFKYLMIREHNTDVCFISFDLMYDECFIFE